MDSRELTLIEHLRELRSCLVRIIIGLIVSALGCYLFAEQILAFLRAPMAKVLGDTSRFVVLAPQEYFFTELKAAAVAGLFVSSPWILWQVWKFIAPALYKSEKKFAATFVLAGASFFIAGGLFSYLAIFPAMFGFFIGTLPAGIEGAYSVGLLFGFATSMLLVFGVVFEAPVIVFMLVWADIVDIETLTKFRRYMIVIAFIIGAILTPPDPLTQVMLAVPLICLYEVGLLAARLMLRKKVLSH